MSRLGWIIILILWILLGLWLCNRYICGIGGVVAPAVIKDKCETSWNISDGSSFNQESNDHIRFRKSSFNQLKESEQLRSTMVSVANYLKQNSDREITLTGYYEDNERNSSVLPNLGLARANTIKSRLNKLGVPTTQIDISSHLGVECWKNDTIQHGIKVAFDKVGVNNTRIRSIKQRLLGKPITVYFGTNQDNIKLDVGQRKDFADLFYYLDRVKGAKLDVSGHTDNVGNIISNTKLSKDRAQFVRDYLIKNGDVLGSKMDVNGYGPSKPVQSNNTPEGRSKNRRVEVTLK